MIKILAAVGPRGVSTEVTKLRSLGIPDSIISAVRADRTVPCILTYNYIVNNWTTNIELMVYMLGKIDQAKAKGYITLLANTSAQLCIVEAFAKAIIDCELDLEQLRPMLQMVNRFAKDIDPSVDLSIKSYAERKVIMAEMQNKLEEIVITDTDGK